MLYIKTPIEVISCADLSVAVAKIHDLKSSEWILSPLPFLSEKDELEQLKSTIKEKGFKRRWIAEKLGISEVHLSKVLNGKYKLTKKLKEKTLKLLENN